MLDVREAVTRAIDYTQTLFGSDNVRGLRFEEVELSDDGYWNITVGFDRAEPPSLQSAIGALFPTYRREYKVVKIDRNSGEVKSVKMRQPA